MGARWMEAKKIKMKNHRQRMRRAYLKPYTADSVTHYGIDKDKGNPWSFSNRNKAAQSFDNPLIKSKFLPLEQQGIGNIQARAVQGHPRAVVLEKLWQGSVRHQGVDGFKYVVMEDEKAVILQDAVEKKTWLFFSGCNFVFVEINEKEDTARRSITYTSRERAMLAFHNNRISWRRNTEL
jgi:hypothetical protein